MTCEKCGFDFGKWVELVEQAGGDKSFRDKVASGISCPMCERAEQTLADDVVCDVCKSLSVGDRVLYVDNGDKGAIEHIALQDAPFRVRWDDGDIDWFKGSQLERL